MQRPVFTPPVGPSAAKRLIDQLPDAYKRLGQLELPEPICQLLLNLLSANRGCGLPAIQASANLKRLVTMSREEIVAIYDAHYAQPATV